MQVQLNLSNTAQFDNNELKFTGKNEVLYNLGKALDKAQEYAIQRDNFILKNPGKYLFQEEDLFPGPLESLRAYIDSATQDNAFSEVIKNIKESLGAKIKLKTDGKSEALTLPQIAQDARVLDKGKKNLFGISLDRFCYELSDIMKSKKINLESESFDNFINELKPENIRKSDDERKALLDEISKMKKVGCNH